ncbi:zinc finger BED domain-containing protein 1-like [Aphis craccivora]|uniref:Zinc finger BED domain-containing protein 1-like n=1 Tax=Aphis craccivora TaxID=307492 RepID=A0A6G0Y387_APHCR|nr:zinc finger BED domain-containing protein 1-like [Aphis craccivora]
MYQRLYLMVRKRLCLTATSVPCKKLFSKAGMVITEKKITNTSLQVFTSYLLTTFIPIYLIFMKILIIIISISFILKYPVTIVKLRIATLQCGFFYIQGDFFFQITLIISKSIHFQIVKSNFLISKIDNNFTLLNPKMTINILNRITIHNKEESLNWKLNVLNVFLIYYNMNYALISVHIYTDQPQKRFHLKNWIYHISQQRNV